jgi:tRNA U34 5-methylaminomethyl-2-thiouridine-forming methyltransferase MnmC
MNKPEIIVTSDGSHSLFSGENGDTYHSVHGAIAESEYVYLCNGFRFRDDLKQLNVLEIGFGTGLNCLLTALEAERTPSRYFALEKFPLPGDIINKLNYPDLKGEKGPELFRLIHEAPWNTGTWINPLFYLKKLHVDALDFSWADGIPGIDVVYFDAFGPDKQPEMWDAELFRVIYRTMNPGAVLVTYCAKGRVRRDLQQAGFQTQRLPGAAGKREMLRVIKS